MTNLPASTLRDVAFLEEIEKTIRTEDYPYLQPVDTWVKRVARSLKIIDERDQDEISDIKGKIISSARPQTFRRCSSMQAPGWLGPTRMICFSRGFRVSPVARRES